MLVNDTISNPSLRQSSAALIQPTLHYLLLTRYSTSKHTPRRSQSREEQGTILREGCFRGVSEFLFNLGSSPVKCPIIEGTVPPTAFPGSYILQFSKDLVEKYFREMLLFFVWLPFVIIGL